MPSIQTLPGSQTAFLSCSTDVALFVGDHGVGKSYALLLDPLRSVQLPYFGAVLARRGHAGSVAESTLWDRSTELYGLAGGRALPEYHGWVFPGGGCVKFVDMQGPLDEAEWQDAEVPVLCIDDLAHVPEETFWCLLHRNRAGPCKVRPYTRLTAGLNDLGWVAGLASWYLNGATGAPIPRRIGAIRHFLRLPGVTIWGNSEDEVVGQCRNLDLTTLYRDLRPRTFTLIAKPR